MQQFLLFRSEAWKIILDPRQGQQQPSKGRLGDAKRITTAEPDAILMQSTVPTNQGARPISDKATVEHLESMEERKSVDKPLTNSQKQRK